MEAAMLHDLIGGLMPRCARGSGGKTSARRKAHRLVALLLIVAPMLAGCRDTYFNAVCNQYHAAVSSVDGNGGDFSVYRKHMKKAQGNLDPAMEDAVGTNGIDKFNQLSAGIRSIMRTERKEGEAPPHIESQDAELACR
jgi:hypothetical protein